MRVVSCVAAVWLAASAPAGAEVVHVATFGQDSSACGGLLQRCRSIGQAVRNASDGDTVVVAPGTYGDLNRNGVIGEPGEESGAPGCGCLIAISKRIVVLSERGAEVTTIDASQIESNDFIANDLDGNGETPPTFCGIENRTGGVVWAENNYWAGSADAGVDVQAACDGPGATTHVEPRKAAPH